MFVFRVIFLKCCCFIQSENQEYTSVLEVSTADPGLCPERMLKKRYLVESKIKGKTPLQCDPYFLPTYSDSAGELRSRGAEGTRPALPSYPACLLFC